MSEFQKDVRSSIGTPVTTLPHFEIKVDPGTINKIKGTPRGVYLPISELHSILALANLLAHNNSWLCIMQVNSVGLK